MEQRDSAIFTMEGDGGSSLQSSKYRSFSALLSALRLNFLIDDSVLLGVL